MPATDGSAPLHPPLPPPKKKKERKSLLLYIYSYKSINIHGSPDFLALSSMYKCQPNNQNCQKVGSTLHASIHIPICEDKNKRIIDILQFPFFAFFLVADVKLLVICPYCLLSTKLLCTRHEGFLINLHSRAKDSQKFLFAQLSNLGKSLGWGLCN